MPKKARPESKAPTRDGSSAARAILEDSNVWRRRHCPGARLGLQCLRHDKGKYFDVLTLFTKEGMRVVWFDVSEFFRKPIEELEDEKGGH